MVMGRKLRHIIKDSLPRKVRISDSLPVGKNNLYHQIFIHQESFFSLNVNRKIEKNYLCRRNFTCQIWEITPCKRIKTIFIDRNFLLIHGIPHQNLHPYLLSTGTTLWVYISYRLSCLEGLHITSETVDVLIHRNQALLTRKGLPKSTCVPISQNDQVHTEIRSPSRTSPPGTSNKNLPQRHSSRTRQSISAVFGVSKRLNFGVLVHIPISQNNQVLTDMVPLRCRWTQTQYYPSHQPVTFPGGSGWHWWVETNSNHGKRASFARVVVILVSCIWK